MNEWFVFQGTGDPHDAVSTLPPPPPWRAFEGGPVTPLNRDVGAGRMTQRRTRASTYQADQHTVQLVNVALYLRRPLLITGPPGVGKSTLAYAVAHELRLGPVLRWPITSRSTLRDGLYRYDAMGRIEENSVSGRSRQHDHVSDDVGRHVRLGPLGTALAPYDLPRVLLIDEIDKSDIDLPNDLLDVFEEGEYEIPELSRITDTAPEVAVRPADDGEKVVVRRGSIRCRAFPFVAMTSNGEREFPPAFLRRCVRLELRPPDRERLSSIIEAHLGEDASRRGMDIIETFLARREHGELATDQLLNAIYLTGQTTGRSELSRSQLADLLLRHLSTMS